MKDECYWIAETGLNKHYWNIQSRWKWEYPLSWIWKSHKSIFSDYAEMTA